MTSPGPNTFTVIAADNSAAGTRSSAMGTLISTEARTGSFQAKRFDSPAEIPDRAWGRKTYWLRIAFSGPITGAKKLITSCS